MTTTLEHPQQVDTAVCDIFARVEGVTEIHKPDLVEAAEIVATFNEAATNSGAFERLTEWYGDQTAALVDIHECTTSDPLCVEDIVDIGGDMTYYLVFKREEYDN